MGSHSCLVLLAVRQDFVAVLVDTHVPERAGQDIRAMAKHLHLPDTIPITATVVGFAGAFSRTGWARHFNRRMRGVNVHNIFSGWALSPLGAVRFKFQFFHQWLSALVPVRKDSSGSE